MAAVTHHSIAQLLDAAADDPATAPELLAQVYTQLRALAQSYLRAERPDHTLQATALVHEAYLRLAGSCGAVRWDSPMEFFAAAAETMRRVLIDHARARRRIKRGGGVQQRVALAGLALAAPEDPDEFLGLDAAIERLTRIEPAMAQVVRLRFFVGLQVDQTAQVLGISTATVKRRWQWARAWLYRETCRDDSAQQTA